MRIVFKAVYPSTLRSRGLSGNKLGGGGYNNHHHSSSYAKKSDRSGGVATIGGGGSHPRHSRPLGALEDGKYGVVDEDDDVPFGGRFRARRGSVSVTVSHRRGDGDGIGYASNLDEIPLTAIRQETHVELTYESASQCANRTQDGMV